jgi:hypothetical protein
MQARRQVCRPMRKLLPGSERFELVTHMRVSVCLPSRLPASCAA